MNIFHRVELAIQNNTLKELLNDIQTGMSNEVYKSVIKHVETILSMNISNIADAVLHSLNLDD